MELKNSDGRNVTLKTNGAIAFEVFVDGDISKTRKFDVTINNGSSQTFTKGLSGLESSGIISTGSSSNDITIKITNRKNLQTKSLTAFTCEAFYYSTSHLTHIA